jgi:hypothetical protein
VMTEGLRVLPPGGHAFVWALPRTSHWTGMALEDAGFEIRDSVHHIFGQGFPKYLDVAKAFDKANGIEPIAIVPPTLGMAKGPNRDQWNQLKNRLIMPPPTTDEAKKWRGWATALRPGHEVWWLVRRPLEKPGTNGRTRKATVIDTIRAYGTGALRTDACKEHCGFPDDAGWPPNFVMTHAPECEAAGACVPWCPVEQLSWGKPEIAEFFPCFYAKKPDGDEKEEGCDELPKRNAAEMTGRQEGSLGLSSIQENGRAKANPYAGTSGAPRANHHPTVKAVSLMEWLVRLITPPDGIVLDPFCGSGSTGVGAVPAYRFVGVERDQDEAGRELGYVAIARARLAHADPGREAILSASPFAAMTEV